MEDHKQQEEVNPYEGKDLDELSDIDVYLSPSFKIRKTSSNCWMKRTKSSLTNTGMFSRHLNSSNDYREKKLSELKAIGEKNKFGYIISITRSEFIDQVTRASNSSFVVCLLYNDSYPFERWPSDAWFPSLCTILDCKIMLKVLEEVAERNPDVKFVKIISTDCIADFPDKYDGSRSVDNVETSHAFSCITTSPL